MSLGRLGGVVLRVHLLFILFGAVTIFLGWKQRVEHQDMLWIACASIGILFASVLLHEIAHYWASLQFGGSGEEIVIWPLGGLAPMRPPYEPQAEFCMHIAGPFCNLVLSLTTAIVLGFVDRGSLLGLFTIPPIGLIEGANLWIVGLKLTCWVNWVLLLANLLPVFPFDGGPALRAGLSVLWPDSSPHRTSFIVSTLAKFAAFALIVVAFLVRNQMTEGIVPLWFALVVLAIFLYFGAKQDAEPREPRDVEDDVFGYDFSQGYTSLQESAERQETQAGPFSRWLEERKAAKLQRKHELEAEEECRADELLGRLHEQGMASLSDEERSLLKRVSARYRARNSKQS